MQENTDLKINTARTPGADLDRGEKTSALYSSQFSFRSFQVDDSLSARPRTEDANLNLLAFDEALREKKELELKIRKLKEKTSKDESRLSSLETENQLQAGKIKELIQSVAYYESKNLELQSQNNSLLETNIKMRNFSNDRAFAESDGKNYVSVLEERVDSLRTLLSQRVDNKNSNEDMKEYTQKLTNALDSLRLSEEKESQLLAKIHNYELKIKEHENSLKLMSLRCEKSLILMQGQHSQIDMKFEDLEKENESLRMQLNQLISDKNGKEKQLNALLESNTKALNTRIQDLQFTISSTEEKTKETVKNYTNQLKQALETLQAKRVRLAELETKVMNLEASNQVLTENLEKERSRADEAAYQRQQLTQEQEQREEFLRSENSQLMQKIASTEQQMRTTIQNLEASLAEASDKLNEKEVAGIELNGKVKDLSRKLALQEKDIVRVKTLDKLAAERAERIQTLEIEMLNAQKSAQAALDAEIAKGKKLEEESDEINFRLQKLDLELQTVRRRLDEKTIEYEGKLTFVEGTLREKEVREVEVLKENQVLEAKLKQKVFELTEAESINLMLRGQISEMTSQMENLKRDLQNHIEQMTSREKALTESSQERIKEQEAHIAEMESTIASIQKQLEGSSKDYQTRLLQIREESLSNEARNHELAHQLEEALERIGSQEKQIRQNQQTKIELEAKLGEFEKLKNAPPASTETSARDKKHISSLEASVATLTSKIQEIEESKKTQTEQLQNNIKSAETRLEQARETIRNQELRLAELSSNLSELQDLLKIKEEQVEADRRSKKMLEEQVAYQTGSIQALNYELSEVKKRAEGSLSAEKTKVNSLTNNLNELKKYVDQLEGTNMTFNIKSDESQRKQNQLLETIRAKEADIIELSDKIKDLEDELLKRADRVRDIAASKMDLERALEREINNVKKSNNDYVKAKKEAEEAVTLERERGLQHIREKELTIAELNAGITVVKNEMAIIQNKLSAANDSLGKKEMNEVNLQAKIQALESEIVTQENIIAEQKRNGGVFEEKIRKNLETITQLKAEIVQLKQEIENQKAVEFKNESSTKNYEASIKNLELRIEEGAKKLQQSKDSISLVEKRNKDLSNTIQELSTKIDGYKLAQREADHEKEMLNSQIQKLTGNIKGLQEELLQVTKTASENVQAEKSRIADLEARELALQDELKSYKQKLVQSFDANRANESKASEITDKLNQLESQKLAIENALKKADIAKKAAEDKINEQSDLIQSLRDAIEQVKSQGVSEIENEREGIRQMEAEADNLRTTIHQLQVKISDYEIKARETSLLHEAQIESLNKDLSEKSQKEQEYADTIQRLQETLTADNDQVKKAGFEKISELTSIINQLETDLKNAQEAVQETKNSADHEISILQARNDRLEEQIQQMKAEQETLEARTFESASQKNADSEIITVLNSKIMELQLQLSEARESTQSTTNFEAEEAAIKLARLQKKYDEYAEKVSLLEEELQLTKQQNVAELTALKLQNAAALDKLNAATSDAGNANETDIRELESKLFAANASLKNLQDKIQGLEKTIAQFEDERFNYKENIKDLEKDVLTLTAQLKKVENRDADSIKSKPTTKAPDAPKNKDPKKASIESIEKKKKGFFGKK